MNPWLVLSLGLSSLTVQKGYYFLSSFYAKCKLWPKTTKRDYGRAKKWTEIFWVLIQACYHKLIFHLLLNNNQSVNPIPIHLQPDGVLICGCHFISCWQFHKPFKALPSCISLPVPPFPPPHRPPPPPPPRDRQLPSRFLQQSLPVFFGGVYYVIFMVQESSIIVF